jgi:hypothetical protein
MENETVIHHVLRILEWGRVSNVVKLLIYTMLQKEEENVGQTQDGCSTFFSLNFKLIQCFIKAWSKNHYSQ